MKWIVHIISFALLFQSCREKKMPREEIITPEVRESIIRANQKLTAGESKEIDNYIRRNRLTMNKSGTGLRYMFLKKGNGDTALSGMEATVKFKLSLLDGSVCYSSESEGPETFTIDQDNVESGLHEGIKLMRKGDVAKFILPSHLAHGLAGDKNCIKARSPVVYDIELLDLK